MLRKAKIFARLRGKPSDSKCKKRFWRHFSPVTIVMAASALTILLLSVLGWGIWKSYLDHKWAEEHSFPIQSLRSQIVLFDEILTMSASMAAATGDRQWQNRYSKYEPQLKTAIKSLDVLVKKTLDSDAAMKTGEANDKLVEMEDEIFELVGQKRLDDARSIVASENYQKQKELFWNSMKQIAEELQEYINTNLENDRKRAFIALESVLLGLPLLTIIWLWTLIKMQHYLKERDRAEQELKVNEERFHSLINNIPGVIYRCELSYPWAVEHISETIFEISGYHAEDLMEGRVQGIGTLIVDEDIEHVKCLVAKATELHQPFELKYRIRHSDGSIRWVHEKGQTIFNAKGKPAWLDGAIEDITERKNAEEEIVDLAKFPSENPNPVLRISGDGMLLYANNTCESILQKWGCRKGEFVGNEWCGIVSEALDTGDEKIVVRELAGRVLSFAVAPVIDAGYANLYCRDITERKHAEEEIVDLAKFPSENPNPVLRISGNGILLYANNACESILQEWGCRKGEFVGNEWCGIVSETLDTGDEKIVVRELAGRVLSFAVAPVIDAGYANLYCRDITEQKEALQSLNLLNNAVIQSSNCIIIAEHIKASENPIIYVNPAFERVTGYTLAEVLGKDSRFMHGNDNDQAGIKEIRQALKERHGCKTVIRNYRKDGIMFWNEINLSPVFDDQNNLTHYIGVSQDITEQKLAEDERERLLNTIQVKKENLQSIVYVASHDLRSPLVNIEGFSNELSQTCMELKGILNDSSINNNIKQKLLMLLDEDITESIKFITAGASKMAMLLNGLLQVSRIGTTELEIKPLDMDKIMDDIHQATEFQIKKADVELILDDIPDCLGDEALTNQLFSNILGNALKYLDPKRQGRIHISGRSDNGKSVYCIEDNGIGIDSANQKRIFEIFQRVDPNDKAGGEGLGLNIVTRILDRLDGKIRVESEPGKGSKFFIALPLAKQYV